MILERVRGNNAGAENKNVKMYQVFEALKDYQLWGICILSTVSCTGSGAVTTFAPIVTNGMGFTVFQSLLLNLPIGALAFFCILGSGYLGQRLPNARLRIVTAACLPVILGCCLMYVQPSACRAVLVNTKMVTGGRSNHRPRPGESLVSTCSTFSPRRGRNVLASARRTLLDTPRRPRMPRRHSSPTRSATSSGL